MGREDIEKQWQEELNKQQNNQNESFHKAAKNYREWEPVSEPIEENSTEDETVEEPSDEVLLTLLTIPLEVSVEVGSRRISLEELFSLKPTSVIVLDKMLSEPVDIKVNGKKIAEGELVVVNDRFGVKITRIISPDERIKRIKGT